MRALLLIFWWMTFQAYALSLVWDASPDSSVVGYILYSGPSSGNYTASLDAGNNLTASVLSPAPGVTLFFAVTAYLILPSNEILESLPSNEVSFTTPVPLSTAADLVSLANSLGPFTPAFASSSIGPYRIIVPHSALTITFTPVVSANATLAVNGAGAPDPNGAWPIVSGRNTFTFRVTSQDQQTTRTYTVWVDRKPGGPKNLNVITAPAIGGMVGSIGAQ